MTEAPPRSPLGAALVGTAEAPAEHRAWDDAVRRGRGHLLQSWRWGAFKELQGWRVERACVNTSAGLGLAQVLFRYRGPVSVGYLPRGPVLDSDDPRLATHLFAAVDDVCRERRAITLVVEPDRSLPFVGRYRDAGFVRGPAHIQPGRTVKVPLLEDEALLNQMHQKTRYNVRLAQRRGVTAVQAAPDDESLGTFYGLLDDTATRNEFGIHPPSYYADFLRVFGDDAILLFALIDGISVVGLNSAMFCVEVIKIYGD